jgi:hypothetical protein
LDVSTAQQRREAIDLRPLDVKGGNLLVWRDMLIIAGAEEIVAVGPPPVERQTEEAADVALVQ